MSLDVPTALLERAQQGEIGDAEFVDCVRLSLPYAGQVISGVREPGRRAVRCSTSVPSCATADHLTE
jgi:hypothetical protein